MKLGKMARGDLVKLSVGSALFVALWLVCAVLTYRWVADVGAGEQVDLHVSEVAQHVGSIAAERGGQVLVNESGDRDASLLLAVPSGTVLYARD